MTAAHSVPRHPVLQPAAGPDHRRGRGARVRVPHSRAQGRARVLAYAAGRVPSPAALSAVADDAARRPCRRRSSQWRERTSRSSSRSAAASSRPWSIGVRRSLLALAAGVAIRALWLTIGAWTLGRLRRTASPLVPPPAAFSEAEARIGVRPGIYVSDRVSGTDHVRPALARSSSFLRLSSRCLTTCRKRSPITSCCTCAGATGSSRSSKKGCARSSGSIRPSGG